MNKIVTIAERFRNRHRRCVCGDRPMPGVGTYTSQLGGVLHRVDGPCYMCDEYGLPLTTPENPPPPGDVS